MRVLLSAVGTPGDVQPIVVASALREALEADVVARARSVARQLGSEGAMVAARRLVAV